MALRRLQTVGFWGNCPFLHKPMCERVKYFALVEIEKEIGCTAPNSRMGSWVASISKSLAQRWLVDLDVLTGNVMIFHGQSLISVFSTRAVWFQELISEKTHSKAWQSFGAKEWLELYSTKPLPGRNRIEIASRNARNDGVMLESSRASGSSQTDGGSDCKAVKKDKGLK